jgi:hypothetical protein
MIGGAFNLDARRPEVSVKELGGYSRGKRIAIANPQIPANVDIEWLTGAWSKSTIDPSPGVK